MTSKIDLVLLCCAAAAMTSSANIANAQGTRGLPPSAQLLLRYDANHDNVVTKEEMEAGLKADFDAADTNHDGCLDPSEVRAENERRLARDREEASPLVDWKNDGCIDMAEFSNVARSYFELIDKKGDGKVTLLELHASSIPLAPPAKPATGGKGGGGGDGGRGGGVGGGGVGVGGGGVGGGPGAGY